nr:PilZ domain-containing protein [Novosphingobium marinum]
MTIRKHQRFAVRTGAHLSRTSEGDNLDGLLVELCLGGCRIGGIGEKPPSIGEQVRVEVDGFRPIEGDVRWSGEGAVGVRFPVPLHTYELDSLLRLCRGAADDEPMRAYG